MECQAMRFLIQLPIPVSEYHNYFGILRYTTHPCPCLPGGRSGGSRGRWDPDVGSRQGSRFRDTYGTEDYEEEDDFGFSKGAKQRIWWSDDSYGGENENKGFGFHGDSISFNWIFKVLRAFGWMIPAVIISLLFGTEHNSILMTLALPLSQSALSLVVDALWGKQGGAGRRRAKSRKRKRTFVRHTTDPWVRRENENNSQNEKKSGDYKSWVSGYNPSAKNEKTDKQDFGGWDELDNQVKINKIPRDIPSGKEIESGVQDRIKIHRRAKGDTPLLVRLLADFFPFLGFWTDLL